MGSIRGKADMRALKKLEEQFKQLEKNKTDEFLRFLTRDLARITLSNVIFRTPVISGDLKRAWTGGVDMSPDAYVQTRSISRKGNAYVLLLFNSMNYASYVEYGHKQQVGRFVPELGVRLKAPWVQGQFMCRKTVADVKARYPSIARRNLEKFLKENIHV